MEYNIRIKKNPQSGWLIGQCEEIPEAITQGRDIDELMFMMADAIELARHSNIYEYLAFGICKQLDIPKPKIN